MKVKEMRILSAIIERKLKKQFPQITKVKITLRFYQEGVYTNIEFQIKSPHPKSGIIKECLISIRAILERATASVIASILIQKIIPLI